MTRPIYIVTVDEKGNRIGYGDPMECARKPSESVDDWFRRLRVKADELRVDVFFPYGPPPDDDEP